jgi:hypothetical protein
MEGLLFFRLRAKWRGCCRQFLCCFRVVCLLPVAISCRARLRAPLSAAMPVASRAPDSQPATFFSLQELAQASGVDLEAYRQRVVELASSQGVQPEHQFWVTSRFALASRAEVVNPVWCRRNRVGLFVSCVGAHGQDFDYPPNLKDKVVQVPVYFTSGRDKLLADALGHIVVALSQGLCVVVHCNQSFHRGPVGFMAILKRLFGMPPQQSRVLLLKHRIIYEAYENETVMQHYVEIVKAYVWACNGTVWQPEAYARSSHAGARSHTGASSWHQQSTASAWSQGPSSSSSSVALAGDSWPSLESARERQTRRGVSDGAARQKASKKSSEPNWKGRYLYRAMTKDLRECLEFGDRVRIPWVRKDTLAEQVLIAVQTGSTTPSPFVHFSWKFEEARLWWRKGRSLQKESGNLLCRVPIEALSQAPNLENALDTLSYVDLSTPQAAQPYIAPYVSFSTVQDLLCALNLAHGVKEVLVAWRGHIPMALFEVIDCDTGEFVRMLDSTVPCTISQAVLELYVYFVCGGLELRSFEVLS